MKAADSVAFLMALYVKVLTNISSPSFSGNPFSIVLIPGKIKMSSQVVRQVKHKG